MASRYVDEGYFLPEGYVEGGSFVVSDALIKIGRITKDDFLSEIMNAYRPGWTEWKPFIIGDYDYRKAAFKIEMEGNGDERIAISELNLTVDVSDVLNRGSVDALDPEPQSVIFERPYHITPEVSVALLSSADNAAVRVTARDRYGFTAEIYETTTGDLLTGSFSWNSAAY